MVEPTPLRPLIWIGSSRRDLRTMPEAVQSRMGYALYVAQQGGRHRDAKPLRGFGGAGTVEFVADHRGDAFRCIYTVRFATAVYVLHVFQKKSKSGREMPALDKRLIEHRLREAEAIERGDQA